MNTYIHAGRLDRYDLERFSESGMGRLAIFAALHVPLGFLFARSAAFASLHAVVALGIGALLALDVRRPDRVACAAAYITGADVLWRMCNTHEYGIFHQFGKYAVVTIMLIWMLRAFRFGRSMGPAIYFLLLLPSIGAAAEVANFAYIRGRVSFNLSGPLALTVAVVFFRQLHPTRDDMVRILTCAACTILAVYGVTLSSTLASGDIQFTHESNFVTSGGYGPNQVSATLGLGVLLLLFLPLLRPGSRLGPFACIAGIIALGVQAALTFSRSGLYSVVGALLATVPFFIGIDSLRRRIMPVAACLVIVALFVIFPNIQDFTGGKFKERVTDTHMSGREDLMVRDLFLWSENPLLGVGPGMSTLSQVEQYKTIISHTEMTRMAAEHGLMGVMAGIVLIGIALTSLRQAPSGIPRILCACFATWSVLFMVHAAMRLVAPAFFFGLVACLGNATDESWKLREDEEYVPAA